MSGYFADEVATGEAFAGRWFHSGDLAVRHPDGNIELRDRGKDIIISGGENISSIEVEQTITARPAVLEAAVIAIPHPHWGERPKAFVTLNQGAAATPQEIIAFCRERLAHYKCPDAVQFGPLPKTSTGKTQKFVPAPARMERPRRADRRNIAPAEVPAFSLVRAEPATDGEGTVIQAEAANAALSAPPGGNPILRQTTANPGHHHAQATQQRRRSDHHHENVQRLHPGIRGSPRRTSQNTLAVTGECR